jgi:predicted nucleic acid-binding protein
LTISRNVLKAEVFYNWNLIATDPDDNKFIDADVAAGADYLVTNDTHFMKLNRRLFRC